MSDRLDGWKWRADDAPEPDTRRRIEHHRRTPREWLRDSWPMLRVALALTVVGALVVTGFQIYGYVTRYHEDTSGPHGDFPRAVGSGAPAAPDRRLPTLPWDTYGIVGGLGVSWDDEGAGTVNVRTGKQYWRYSRKETSAKATAFSRRTVAQWWDDGVLVGLDIRTGEPRWHTEAPYAGPDGKEDSNGILRILDGRLVTATQDRVTAYDEDSGKRLWSTRLPKGCTPEDRDIYAMSGVYTLHVWDCGERGNSRLGLDRRTGDIRWRIPDTAVPTRRLDRDTLVWERAGLARADLSGARPKAHPEVRLPDNTHLSEAADGILVTVHSGGSGLDTDDVLQGRSAQGDYKVRWTLRPDRGKRLSRPLLADGKVYVVQQQPLDDNLQPKPGPAALLVLDSDSGRLLHTTRLPGLKPTSGDYSGSNAQLMPWQAQDGLVAVRWDGEFSAATERIMLLSDE